MFMEKFKSDHIKYQTDLTNLQTDIKCFIFQFDSFIEAKIRQSIETSLKYTRRFSFLLTRW